MTDFYSQNRCVCSKRSHGPLLCAFCLSFHFKLYGLSYIYSVVCCSHNFPDRIGKGEEVCTVTTSHIQ